MGQQSSSNKQINVNWIYGAYVPKDVALEPLTNEGRWKLYLRQTYTTPGIYVKTILFTTRDQIQNSPSEWGDGIEGYAKRVGSRQAQFVIQNSLSAAGNAVVGWEPRYDRCRCDGLWPRTRHAIVRNFVTYDRTEKGSASPIVLVCRCIWGSRYRGDMVSRESERARQGVSGSNHPGGGRNRSELAS